jgi:peptidyl-prolyl cis-trans isomerase A (cyclophilin A)
VRSFILLLTIGLFAGSAVSGPPRVVMSTTAGRMIFELDPVHAPVTSCNFERYVVSGAYAGGVFRRVVRMEATSPNPVPIGVVQAYPDSRPGTPAFAPIALERTSLTGLHHGAGTLSMARDGPDSATAEFFVVVADSPELDYGGKRNRDGQGFAAFGRLVAGRRVLERIYAGALEGDQLQAPVGITAAKLVGKACP